MAMQNIIKQIPGGVCAAKGFVANGIHAGIRASQEKKDLAMVLSEGPSNAAGVYTNNLVKSATITVTKAHIANGKAEGIIVNSGIANTCTDDGVKVAEEMCNIAAKATGLHPEDFVVCSTGVIGKRLPLGPIEEGMPKLVSGLSTLGHKDAACAIMTTDTRMKECAVQFELSGRVCHLGGMAKGSGMIHPNMSTMLVFLTTDVAISAGLLQNALSSDVKKSFNMISIDGDTSTNDTVILMANGKAQNPFIGSENKDYAIFMKALNSVTIALCRMIAGDGEGATKLLECIVSGAKDEESAKIVAKSVISSSLTKAAMFGADANWGRVLCAIGYSGADVDVSKIDVSFRSEKGTIDVCKDGFGIDFSEEKAKEILLMDEVDILVCLNSGEYQATAWGCDLTYDYVKINGDYRT